MMMRGSTCDAAGSSRLLATDRLALWLGEQGYAEITIARYCREARWLAAWLASRRMEPSQLTAVSAAEFGVAMRAAGHTSMSARGAVRLANCLRASGAVPEPAPGAVEVPTCLALTEAYRDHLASRRLAPLTIRGRLAVAGLVLDTLGDAAVSADRVVLSPQAVTGMVTSWGALARWRASPLRVFLRFLLLAGYVDEDLSELVPRVRKTSPARQARVLTAGQAQRLVDSVDVTCDSGKRDKAVLLLLWRLGLRAAEITRIDLDDVRWRAGTLLVHRKSGRDEEQPLLADVGEALAGYLAVRPGAAPTRAAVLTMTTPRRRMSLHGLTSMVWRRSKAQGTAAGPHQFRHLLGDQLLAAGQTLAEIAEVLGHAEGDLATTIRYVTPPRQQMAGLVRPWPAASRPVAAS